MKHRNTKSFHYYCKVFCLLAGIWTYGRYVFLFNVRLINCRFLLFRSSASSFSSQYLLRFLKSSISCVLLLPTPFTSVICPSMASRKHFFSEYDQSTWLSYVGYLGLGYYLEVFLEPLHNESLTVRVFSFL